MEKYICQNCKRILEVGDEYVQSPDGITCRSCHEAQKFPCEVYSRVVGYIRPVKQWNNGKQEEFKDRVEFKNGCCSHEGEEVLS